VAALAATDRVFAEYPDCQLELGNCQWQVGYQDLTSDMMGICKDEAFRTVSVFSEDWSSLDAKTETNRATLDAARFFCRYDTTPAPTFA
jgi:hypothetical protein